MTTSSEPGGCDFVDVLPGSQSIGSPCDETADCMDPGGGFIVECREQENDVGCVCTATNAADDEG